VYRPQQFGLIPPIQRAAAAAPAPPSQTASPRPAAPPVYRPQQFGLVPSAAIQRTVAPAHTPVVQRHTPVAVPVSANPLPSVIQQASKRPTFNTNSKRGAFIGHNLFSGRPRVNLKKPRLTSINAAMPHRMSWKAIRDSTARFCDGEDDDGDFTRWTDRFIKAGREKIKITKGLIEAGKGDRSELEDLLESQTISQDAFVEARDELLKDSSRASWRKEFEKQANQFHANVPDIGPHRGVNNPVQDHPHLHVSRSRSRGRSKRKRSLSPMSKRVREMSPDRLSAYPVDDEGDLITTTGATIPVSKLDKETRDHIREVGTKTIKGYDDSFKW
jgi:hypothetical protein